MHHNCTIGWDSYLPSKATWIFVVFDFDSVGDCRSVGKGGGRTACFLNGRTTGRRTAGWFWGRWTGFRIGRRWRTGRRDRCGGRRGQIGTKRWIYVGQLTHLFLNPRCGSGNARIHTGECTTGAGCKIKFQASTDTKKEKQ